uniref:Uncharacterized protein n=1 Tax=Anguilla anguilla TaxID=7936 RepID=A0A0E9SIL9_ANGAN
MLKAFKPLHSGAQCPQWSLMELHLSEGQSQAKNPPCRCARFLGLCGLSN